MSWDKSEMRAAVEALLFASDRPVSLETLCEVLGRVGRAEVEARLQELTEAYNSNCRGLQIVRAAGGYHIRTRSEYALWVERLLRRRKRMRLSQAALETLAIVAYKQPVTRAEIEAIRGVDAGGVLGTLLERNLIAIRGRSKGPGRPLLYGTTQEFLDHFGLNDLQDLPSPEELESLLAQRDGAGAGVEDEPAPPGGEAEALQEAGLSSVAGEEVLEDAREAIGKAQRVLRKAREVIELERKGGASGGEQAGSSEAGGQAVEAPDGTGSERAGEEDSEAGRSA